MTSHKANFENYIDPNYGHVTEVDIEKITKEFQTFLSTSFTRVPDVGTPKSPYNYNAHMGQFVRFLDAAKDEYIKGVLAFHGTQGHGKRKIEED